MMTPTSPGQDDAGDEIAIFRPFFSNSAGTRFDVTPGGSRRISGMRNFRQALASPYPVVTFHDSCAALSLLYELSAHSYQFTAISSQLSADS
jgi:hypothetical protein